MQNCCDEEDVELKAESPTYQSEMKVHEIPVKQPEPIPTTIDSTASETSLRDQSPDITGTSNPREINYHHQHQHHRSPLNRFDQSSSKTTRIGHHGVTSVMKPNQVRTVVLNGTPIVALVIDGKERLCLAQISNTLLKSFSYNEIHNRRVALGITCVQCTPVQLEILRRAGAMPISSRRCGMISKREAERLCKSFLTENCPPKLPDNFSFEVIHECAWGCRGSFLPSRYNSSRAKCIKCSYCNLFFSPNKFIFHSHRLPESKYVQPDAANFNSWRRHLKLSDTPMDEVIYAWEDVKAMFNGGSRKRVMAASISRFHHLKRPRVEENTTATSNRQPIQPSAMGSSGISTATTVPPEHPSRGAPPYVSMLTYPSSSNKASYGLPTDQNAYLARRGASGTGVISGMVTHCGYDGPTPGSLAYPGIVVDKNHDVNHVTVRGHPFVDYMWAGKQTHSVLPSTAAATASTSSSSSSSYGFISWSGGVRQPGLPATQMNSTLTPTQPPQQSKPNTNDHFYELDRSYRDIDSGSDVSSRAELDDRCESSCSERDFRSSDDNDDIIRQPSLVKEPGVMSPTINDQITGGVEKQIPIGYCSAFRPVIRVANSSGASLHSVESLIRPTSGGDIVSNPHCSNNGPKFNGYDSRVYYEKSEKVEDENHSSKSLDSDNVIDVEITDDSKDAATAELQKDSTNSVEITAPNYSETTTNNEVGADKFKVDADDINEERKVQSVTSEPQVDEQESPLTLKKMSSKETMSAGVTSSTPLLLPLQNKGSMSLTDASAEESSDTEPSMPSLDMDDNKSTSLTKEELQEILLQETLARKRAERQCEVIKETFQEQVKREVAYREEITKQLDVVKGASSRLFGFNKTWLRQNNDNINYKTLCNELDQERKARFSVLQKLKEAHDALHHFSCKVLLPRQCSECSYRPLIPQ